MGKILLHLWIVDLLHLWLKVITVIVGITFMVFITFMIHATPSTVFAAFKFLFGRPKTIWKPYLLTRRNYFENGEKNSRFQKKTDTCGRGLRVFCGSLSSFFFFCPFVLPMGNKNTICVYSYNESIGGCGIVFLVTARPINDCMLLSKFCFFVSWNWIRCILLITNGIHLLFIKTWLKY